MIKVKVNRGLHKIRVISRTFIKKVAIRSMVSKVVTGSNVHKIPIRAINLQGKKIMDRNPAVSRNPFMNSMVLSLLKVYSKSCPMDTDS